MACMAEYSLPKLQSLDPSFDIYEHVAKEQVAVELVFVFLHESNHQELHVFWNFYKHQAESKVGRFGSFLCEA